MEKEMETTIVLGIYRGYIRMMENKMETTINTTCFRASLCLPELHVSCAGFMNDKTKFLSTPGRVTSTMRAIMVSNNFSEPQTASV